MTKLEQGELRVVVPVGFLLAEEREVSISIDRPDGTLLPIRLQLIPARQTVTANAVTAGNALTLSWVDHHEFATTLADEFTPEFGGSD